MMEHVIDLLRRHGFDEIVVTVAFLANAIKTYFGDGSEFGVHDRRTPTSRSRSAPPARVAQRQGAPRRALPRDLRRRHHRHRPHQDRRLPRRARGAWPPSASSRSRTRSSSASSSPARTAPIERFLEKPTWGQVFSDTINTGIYVLDPAIFDYIDPTVARSTSPARCSRSCSPTASRCTAPVAEGYWEDVGTLEAYLRAHKDVLDQRVAARHPRLPDQRRRLAGRGGRGLARRPGDRAGGHRAGLQGRGGLPPRRVRRARHRTSACSADADLERTRRARQRLHRHRTPACAAPWSGAVSEHPLQRPHATRASCSATRCSSAPTPCSATTSRCTRSRRSRTAPSSTPRSSGRAGAPAACSGARA